eukprot:5689259-Prymnesium_polylepis.1
MDCYVTVQESWKRLTEPASLPLIVQVVTVTVLLPSIAIPPPCKGEDQFSSSITLHWGAGVDLSQGKRSLPAGKVRESTTNSMRGGEGQSVNPTGRWSGFE